MKKIFIAACAVFFAASSSDAVPLSYEHQKLRYFIMHVVEGLFGDLPAGKHAVIPILTPGCKQNPNATKLFISNMMVYKGENKPTEPIIEGMRFDVPIKENGILSIKKASSDEHDVSTSKDTASLLSKPEPLPIDSDKALPFVNKDELPVGQYVSGCNEQGCYRNNRTSIPYWAAGLMSTQNDSFVVNYNLAADVQENFPNGQIAEAIIPKCSSYHYAIDMSSKDSRMTPKYELWSFTDDGSHINTSLLYGIQRKSQEEQGKKIVTVKDYSVGDRFVLRIPHDDIKITGWKTDEECCLPLVYVECDDPREYSKNKDSHFFIDLLFYCRKPGIAELDIEYKDRIRSKEYAFTFRFDIQEADINRVVRPMPKDWNEFLRAGDPQ